MSGVIGGSYSFGIADQKSTCLRRCFFCMPNPSPGERNKRLGRCVMENGGNRGAEQKSLVPHPLALPLGELSAQLTEGAKDNRRSPWLSLWESCQRS